MLKRTLFLKSGSTISSINILIMSPVEIDIEEFDCQLTIEGSGFSLHRAVKGLDSMQAMLLALRVAREVITSSEAYASGNIFWLEEGNDINLAV